MKLKGFYIRSFHNVSRQSLPVGGLHVLAGRNGAGKSSVLSAVALLGDQPNPFAGLTELGLQKADTGVAAVRIYELDDDLSGEYILDNRHRRALRSDAVVELVFSVLGPAALENVITIGEPYDGPPDAVLDLDQLRKELNRAVDLFKHCGLVSYLSEMGAEDVVAGFSEFTLPVWQEHVSPVVSAYEATGWRLRYGDAATELLKLLRQARKIVWSPTSGYNGVVIDRSEISGDLGDALTEIADGYGDHNEFLDQQGFFDLPEIWDPNQHWLRDQLFASLPGYSPVTVPPVMQIAQQWTSNEPLLFLRLSPDVGHAPPYVGSPPGDSAPRGYQVESVQPVSSGYDDEEFAESIQASLKSSRDMRMHSTFEELSGRLRVEPLVERTKNWQFPPNGPNGFAAVVASGDATGLTEEIEAALPQLFNHVWRFVRSAAAGQEGRAAVEVMSPEAEFIFGKDAKRGSRLLQRSRGALQVGDARGWWQSEEVSVDPWYVAIPADELGWTLGHAYVRRPGLETVCKVLAHKANDIAPVFVLEGGLITINLRQVPIEAPVGGNIEVRYDNKLLEDLPAGTARWVAITVRIAGRLLLESKLLLREVWGSEEEKDKYLNALSAEQRASLEEHNSPDRYGILQHAIEVLNSDNPYPEFEIVPSADFGDTVLLVDEPELHLHQDALLDVRKWLRDRTSERAITAMVATHSPIFMDYSPEEATVHGLLTMADGGAELIDMTSGLDAWLDVIDAEALGIASLDGLFAYRGFLLVEGKHDMEVLRHFYCDELKAKRIGVIPMWGTRDKLDLTEARYLQLARRPIAMLLDNIPDDSSTGRDMTAEQRDLLEYKKSFEREGIQFLPEGHGIQDIIYALPEAAVQRHVEERTGTSPRDGLLAEISEKMQTEFRYEKSQVKKKTAQEMLGLPSTKHGLSVDNFIGPVLEQCRDGDRPHESLEKAMQRIWGFFDSHDRYS